MLHGHARAWAELPAVRPSYLRLLLVRHGESIANRDRILEGGCGDSGDKLTEKGKEDARGLARALRDIVAPDGDVGTATASSSSLPKRRCHMPVASSQMVRAVETAALLREMLAADDGDEDCMVIDGLEELHYGRLAGNPTVDVLDEIRGISASWRSGDLTVKVGETGECPLELQERALAGIQRLVQEVCKAQRLGANAGSGPGYAVLVAHSWVNKILLCTWRKAPLESFQQTQQENCCVNVVDISTLNPADAEVHIVNWRPQVELPGVPEVAASLEAKSKV